MENKVLQSIKVELIDPSVEEIRQEDLLKHIELCGRVCYKSEDKITEDSAEKFVRNIVKRGHTSVLEHGTVYISTPYEMCDSDSVMGRIQRSPYEFSIVDEPNMVCYTTTNFRVILNACEGDLDRALKLVNDYKPLTLNNYIKRRTFRITCDRGVSHELVRHRVFSFSQESTRYVNNTKKKFLFIKPAWWDDELLNNNCPAMDNIYKFNQMPLFRRGCEDSAEYYSSLIELGQTPQQARAVLNNAIKTEVVMTGTEPQWEEFLRLRTDKAAHPDMQIIANKIKELLYGE